MDLAPVCLHANSPTYRSGRQCPRVPVEGRGSRRARLRRARDQSVGVLTTVLTLTDFKRRTQIQLLRSGEQRKRRILVCAASANRPLNRREKRRFDVVQDLVGPSLERSPIRNSCRTILTAAAGCHVVPTTSTLIAVRAESDSSARRGTEPYSGKLATEACVDSTPRSRAPVIEIRLGAAGGIDDGRPTVDREMGINLVTEELKNDSQGVPTEPSGRLSGKKMGTESGGR